MHGDGVEELKRQADATAIARAVGIPNLVVPVTHDSMVVRVAETTVQALREHVRGASDHRHALPPDLSREIADAVSKDVGAAPRAPVVSL